MYYYIHSLFYITFVNCFRYIIYYFYLFNIPKDNVRINCDVRWRFIQITAQCLLYSIKQIPKLLHEMSFEIRGKKRKFDLAEFRSVHSAKRIQRKHEKVLAKISKEQKLAEQKVSKTFVRRLN